MGKRIMAFTLVELTVVITIIVILSTFVAINLTSAQKKARDDKRVSDAHILANALDQYATTNQRKYPCPVAPDPTTDLNGCIAGNMTYDKREIVFSIDPNTIYDKLKAYVNPVPTDKNTGDYKYIYIFRKDGGKAFIVVNKSESSTVANQGICNSPSTGLPADVAAQVPESCYFVAR